MKKLHTAVAVIGIALAGGAAWWWQKTPNAGADKSASTAPAGGPAGASPNRAAGPGLPRWARATWWVEAAPVLGPHLAMA